MAISCRMHRHSCEVPFAGRGLPAVITLSIGIAGEPPLLAFFSIEVDGASATHAVNEALIDWTHDYCRRNYMRIAAEAGIKLPPAA